MRLCKTKAALSRVFRREYQEKLSVHYTNVFETLCSRVFSCGVTGHNKELILYKGQFSRPLRYSQNPLIRTLKGP